MIIYMATNIINGKSYIGQTVGSLMRRKQEHIGESLTKRVDNYFHRAIRKYNPDNFTWEILHDNINTIEELNKLEIYYIRKFDTFKNGYNLTLGGGGSIGFKHTKKSKRKITTFNKIRFANKENHPMFGKKHSDETKKKMSDNHADFKGRKSSLSRAVIINKQYFYTVQEAADFLNIHRGTICRRIKRRVSGYNYAGLEKKDKAIICLN